jgi:hypothetical protein
MRLREQYFFYILTSVLILISSIIYIIKLSPLAFIYDDSYIILHNIQVLITGVDINYPGVNALNGTTSLAYLCLARLFSYFLSPIYALYTVSWIAILFYALGLLKLAFLFSASRIQTILFLISGLLIGYVPFHLLSGLETGLALAAITWTLVFLTTKQRTPSNLLLGLLPFIRPELIFFTFILWASRGFQYWREEKNYKALIYHLFCDGLTILISALPFALWYFIELGTPYPDTLLAKKYFFAEEYIPLPKKILGSINIIFAFFSSLGIFNAFGMLILMFLMPLTRIFLLFFFVFLMLFTLCLPHALQFNSFRYLYIFLPFMFYGLISSIKYPNKFISKMANIILIISSISALFYSPSHLKNYLFYYQYMVEERLSFINWCDKNIPPNTTILVQDAGYLAYATSFHLIDMVGLKTPDNIIYHQKITFPSVGKERSLAIAKIAWQTHPQYLIVTQEWNHLFHIVDGLNANGFNLEEKRVSKDGYLVYKFI